MSRAISISAARATVGWLILTQAAKAQRTMTCSELMGRILGITGYKANQSASHVLSCLEGYCMQRELPPLTALVLGKNGVRPGPGYPRQEDPTDPAVLRSVAIAGWDSIPQPMAREFDNARIWNANRKKAAKSAKVRKYLKRIAPQPSPAP